MTIKKQSIFKFAKKNSENYVKTLCKYYENVDITMKIDNRAEIKGTINKHFFDNNLINCNKIVIETDYHDNVIATIKSMQKYDKNNLLIKYKHNGKNDNLINKIDEGIQERLNLGYREVCFTLELGKFGEYHFYDILSSFSYINNDFITRYYISYASNNIIIVLKDAHVMAINSKEIGDTYLPSLDIDEGFSNNGVLTDEFQDHFKIWLSEFKRTNGNNWASDIIKNKII